jgi:molybdopterin molybdotransferase
MNQCDPKTEPLIAYDEALKSLVERVTPTTKIVSRPLLQALGEVLAQDQRSSIDVPPADNSAMDGYALNIGALAASGDTALPVSQRIAAGEAGSTLASGTAARIFTGAPIPSGADAVIMQEQVKLVDDTIHFAHKPASGENIRLAGNDIRRGDTILSKGCRLRSQELGIAASIGLQTLPVFDKIRVGIFFTGNELVEPGQKLEPGKIYDSNRYTLHGLLQAMGCEMLIWWLPVVAYR